MTIENLDLIGYWRILICRRWSIYLAVTTVLLVALVGSFLTTPLYRGTATLQIDRLAPDILDGRDLARPDYGWSAIDHFYETQYTIIGSKPVARLAAERLELTSHPAFSDDGKGPGLLARLKALLPRKNRPQIEVDPLDSAVAQVLGGLEVAPIQRSFLVEVSWVHPDPVLAADVANAVAEAYIRFNMRTRFSSTDQAREFLVDQTGTLKREISAMEVRLREYAESKNIFTVDEANNLTLAALHDISEQRTAAQTNLARAEAAHRAVSEAAPESMPEVLNSTLIDRLRAEYAAYEAEHSEQSRTFKDDWPELQTLESKIDQARERLDIETARIVEQVRATAAADYLQARGEVHNLEELLHEHEHAAQLLKRDAVEYNNLQSEVLKKREILDALLRRQNEMALSTRLKQVDTTSSNVTIVQRAEPRGAPFRPNTRLNLAMGLIVGLMLGCSLAFILDYIDNTVGSPAELEQILAMPVLAVIPRHAGGSGTLSRRKRGAPQEGSIYLAAQRDLRSAASEAYRALRTSILLSNPGSPPRQIVITSACPGEGKTGTALNLAVVLAQLGRRVLLVDTDLRRPRLQRAFGLDGRRGVSTYLAGQEQDPSRLVQRSGVEGLDVMPSGPIPPNPSELLNSPIFSGMGARMIELGYDHVLFDTPPVLSVSDPVIVSSVADTGILVVRAHRTPKPSIRLAADRLMPTGGGSFGVVLNDFDAEQTGFKYSPYYYEYHDDETAEEPDAGLARPASGGA